MNIIVWDSGITQPKDKGILLKDIIENEPNGYNITQKLVDGFNAKKTEWKGRFNPHSEPFDKKAFCLTSRMHKCGSTDNYLQVTGGAFRGRNKDNPSDRTLGIETEQRLEINETGKSNALTSVSKDSLVISNYNCDNPVNIETEKMNCLRAQAGGITKGIGITTDNITWRKLTPIECERLQTVPDRYSDHVSNSQRYKMLGNGWTIDAVSHIFRNIK